MKALHIVDYMLQNAGQPPSKKVLKNFGHNLIDLYKSTVQASQRYSSVVSSLSELDAIKVSILELLSIFARYTRYHNLDALAAGVANSDPLSEWASIFDKILMTDVKPAQISRVLGPAYVISKDIADKSYVIMHDLNQQPMDHFSVFAQPGLDELAARYAVLHVVQFLVPLRDLLSDMCHQAYGMPDSTPRIPQLQEFLEWLWNDRTSVLRKKRWP